MYVHTYNIWCYSNMLCRLRVTQVMSATPFICTICVFATVKCATRVGIDMHICAANHHLVDTPL